MCDRPLKGFLADVVFLIFIPVFKWEEDGHYLIP